MIFEILTIIFFLVALVFVLLYVLKHNTSSKIAATLLNPVSSTAPAVPASGSGYSIVTVNKDKKSIHASIYVGSIGGLITMAHIHASKADGSIGENILPLIMTNKVSLNNGFLVKNLALHPSDLIGSFKGKSISDFLSNLENGHLWVNVHTTTFPMGEIQGKLQLL